LLRPGAMSYWHFTFDQDTKKINKVVFNLMVNISNPYFTCQALLKVGNEWVVEDWTGIKERSFAGKTGGESPRSGGYFRQWRFPGDPYLSFSGRYYSKMSSCARRLHPDYGKTPRRRHAVGNSLPDSRGNRV